MMRVGLAALVLALLLVPLTRSVRADGETVEGRVTVNPLEVSLYLAPHQVAAGDLAAAAVLVRNLGDEEVTGLAISLRFEPVSVSAIPVLWAPDPTLAADGLAWQAWSLCAKVPAQYMVLATATALDSGGQLIRAESKAAMLTVTKGNGRCPRGY